MLRVAESASAGRGPAIARATNPIANTDSVFSLRSAPSMTSPPWLPGAGCYHATAVLNENRAVAFQGGRSPSLRLVPGFRSLRHALSFLRAARQRIKNRGAIG